MSWCEQNNLTHALNSTSLLCMPKTNVGTIRCTRISQDVIFNLHKWIRLAPIYIRAGIITGQSTEKKKYLLIFNYLHQPSNQIHSSFTKKKKVGNNFLKISDGSSFKKITSYCFSGFNHLQFQCSECNPK